MPVTHRWGITSTRKSDSWQRNFRNTRQVGDTAIARTIGAICKNCAPHEYRGYWDFDGNQQTGYLHIDNHWEFNSGMEIHTGTNFTQEGVFEPFEIVDGVTGRSEIMSIRKPSSSSGAIRVRRSA